MTILPLPLLSHYVGMTSEIQTPRRAGMNGIVPKYISQDWIAHVGDRVMVILSEVGKSYVEEVDMYRIDIVWEKS